MTNNNNVDCIKRFLKNRLQFDYITLHGYESERLNIKKVLQRTIEYGESNSLLIVGPRSCGKTTLINAVLADLLDYPDFIENTLVVHLNGIVHTDDRVALRSITLQLNLETAVNGKVFTSFAENLAFLLDSLRSGGGRNKSKSVIFILEEFDMFCTHHNQTLLYNLFDVAQSAQAPIGVVGITCRLDVIELLEKRVKSRFSHRQVFLLPKSDAFPDYVALFGKLLSLPLENKVNHVCNERRIKLDLLKSNELVYKFNNFDATKYQLCKKSARTWNEHIAKLLTNNVVKNALQTFFNYDVNEAFMKKIIYKIVSQLNTATQPFVTPQQLEHLASMYEIGIDDKMKNLVGLSVLELCIVIAMKHHTEIYDRDPFNFEIIFARFMKFSKYSNTMKNIERSIAVRAFEHLCNIEFILPLTAHSEKHQKDFAMHRLTLTSGQIDEAIQKYQGLPTEISQWSQTGLIQC